MPIVSYGSGPGRVRKSPVLIGLRKLSETEAKGKTCVEIKKSRCYTRELIRQ